MRSRDLPRTRAGGTNVFALCLWKILKCSRLRYTPRGEDVFYQKDEENNNKK